MNAALTIAAFASLGLGVQVCRRIRHDLHLDRQTRKATQ